MVCERCGCRMVAKSGSSAYSLVCVDCGHPANSREYQDLARRSWSATLALVAVAVFSGLVLSFAVLLDLHQDQNDPEPAAMDRAE
jgi:hypothetical protein